MVDPDSGIEITFRPHTDGNPLHWRMTVICPHGEDRPPWVVVRRELIRSMGPDLAANHRITTRCDCRLVDLQIAPE